MNYLHLISCIALLCGIFLFYLLDCGITIPAEELTQIVENTINALRAQILERDEAERLEQEVQNALKARDLEQVSYFAVKKH